MMKSNTYFGCRSLPPLPQKKPGWNWHVQFVVRKNAFLITNCSRQKVEPPPQWSVTTVGQFVSLFTQTQVLIYVITENAEVTYSSLKQISLAACLIDAVSLQTAPPYLHSIEHHLLATQNGSIIHVVSL